MSFENRVRTDHFIPFHQVKIRLKTVLNKGAFGTIHSAKYNSQEIVAKAIEWERCRTYEKEILHLKSFNSCFILTCFGYTEDNHFKYILLEKCQGNLQQYVKGELEDIPVGCIHEKILLAQLVTGLSHIHGKRIVHKDLKPSNILLRKYGEYGEVVAKIGDFGISKALREESSELSATFSPGTHGYIAPEVLEQDKPFKLKFRSDIFALGVVFFYVLSKGQHPFGGNNHVRNNWVTLGIPNLRAISSQWDAVDLIYRMIHKNSKVRPSVFVILLHPYFTNFTGRTQWHFAVTLQNLEEKMKNSQWKQLMNICQEDHLQEWCHILRTDLNEMDSYKQKPRPLDYFLEAKSDKEAFLNRVVRSDYDEMMAQLRQLVQLRRWTVMHIWYEMFCFPTTFTYFIWCSLNKFFSTQQHENFFDLQCLDYVTGMIYGCEAAMSTGMNILHSSPIKIQTLVYLVDVNAVNRSRRFEEFFCKKGLKLDDKQKETTRLVGLFLDPFLQIQESKLGALNKHGMTVIHYAVQHQSRDLVEFLLEKGANLETVDADGRTALHYAARYASKDMVDFLYRKGCKLDAVDKHGKTTVHYAKENELHAQSIRTYLWQKLVSM